MSEQQGGGSGRIASLKPACLKNKIFQKGAGGPGSCGSNVESLPGMGMIVNSILSTKKKKKWTSQLENRKNKTKM
jgi:hypothetical protein